MGSRHDRAARRIARKFRAKYRRKGVDVVAKDRAIEVACSLSDLYQSMRQLISSRRRIKYLAVPRELQDIALKLTKGTGIGVMNLRGEIIKRARGRGGRR